MAVKTYKTYTVRELISTMKEYCKSLPKGLDSPVYSGDFEGNYTHILHEPMLDRENSAMFIGYEMHEDMGN